MTVSHFVSTHSPRKGLLFVSALLCSTALVMEANAAPVPGGADASQVERRFQETPQPRATREPVVENKARPVATDAQSTKQFTLKQINITGNTIYSTEELKAYYNDMIGKQVTLAELQQMASDITARDQQDGCIISAARLPSQTINKGEVQLQIVEGYIGNVTIEGQHEERTDWRNLVQDFGDKIKAQRPLNVKKMERYLLLIDDLPGVTAKGVVRPTANPEVADLVIVLAHKKYNASFNTNNRGTRFVGPFQHTATADANSLFGLYDRTLIRGITTSPTKELRFFDIQHEEQIGKEGTKAVLTAGFSHTEPGYTLSPLEIKGESESYNLTVAHPFLRSRKENFTARATFNHRHNTTDILGQEFNNDRLNVVRAGGAYDLADRFAGINLVDAEISQGLDIWGATDSGALRSRTDGEADFTKVNIDIARLQDLTNNFSLFASFSAQYAFDPLLASEEFTLGGANFGQAYDPSELTGDHGVAGKLELRYSRDVGYKYFQNYQAYGFYDIGKVWEKDFPAGVKDEASLASAGLGLRLNLNEHVSGDAQLAFPLTKNVAIENDDDPRFFFNLTARF